MDKKQLSNILTHIRAEDSGDVTSIPYTNSDTDTLNKLYECISCVEIESVKCLAHKSERNVSRFYLLYSVTYVKITSLVDLFD